MSAQISEEVAVQLEALGIRRGNYVVEPLNRIQKLIATRLTDASRDIPTFPLTIDLVIDALLARRADFNDGRELRVSVNDLLIKACALALTEVPVVNSSFTPLGMVRHQKVDIAMAVGTNWGLITPIIFGAQDKDVAQIAAAARDLSERARAGKLQSDEYIGGTFAVSNLGMFGIASFASIINPPHAAILSVGAARRAVVVSDSGQMHPANVMTVTLTCDHRVIDGIAGARWLQALRGIIEQPNQLFESKSP